MIDDATLVIKRKCEQYWNEPAPEAPEFHAILEFIHQQVSSAEAEIRRLREDQQRRISGESQVATEFFKRGDEIEALKADLTAHRAVVRELADHHREAHNLCAFNDRMDARPLVQQAREGKT